MSSITPVLAGESYPSATRGHIAGLFWIKECHCTLPSIFQIIGLSATKSSLFRHQRVRSHQSCRDCHLLAYRY
ncbi:hypothetical protein BDV28DRAFT_30096 [Aspergillus coremiiformis]|uniref:Uncharacterized protein n=1 Tax=Aspergillus coremiiformis TaxID=138285 RepID=A0A5N6YZH5_9EURO|nr:hypothetical protein BDV28DRAFT_30096 [Aspergillus coremiiformis]